MAQITGPYGDDQGYIVEFDIECWYSGEEVFELSDEEVALVLQYNEVVEKFHNMCKAKLKERE